MGFPNPPETPVMDPEEPLRGYFCGYGGLSFRSGVGATGSFDDVISGGAASADVQINYRWALFTQNRYRMLHELTYRSKLNGLGFNTIDKALRRIENCSIIWLWALFAGLFRWSGLFSCPTTNTTIGLPGIYRLALRHATFRHQARAGKCDPFAEGNFRDSGSGGAEDRSRCRDQR